MKKIYLILFLVILPIGASGSEDDINVMNYFAMTNSLDGQPMLDRLNVLRFFPVFAMRDSTYYVKVTIHYGSLGAKIYSREAERSEDQAYWQVALPKFQLGEAIQKIEVEAHVYLDTYFRSKIASIRRGNDPSLDNIGQKGATHPETILKSFEQMPDLVVDQSNAEKMTISFNSEIQKVKEDIGDNIIPSFFDVPIIANTPTLRMSEREQAYIVDAFYDDHKKYSKALKEAVERRKAVRDTWVQDLSRYSWDFIDKTLIDLVKVGVDTIGAREIAQKYLVGDESFKNDLEKKIKAEDRMRFERVLKKNISVVDKIQQDIDAFRRALLVLSKYYSEQQALADLRQVKQDSLEKSISREILKELSDTLYTGSTVRAATLRVFFDENVEKRSQDENEDPNSIKIFYTNYKRELRQMLTLDPAESMGVFRVRYVPFPIVGTPTDGTMRLLRPNQEGSPTVFEIGLRVGDIVMPGDDFVVPLFSLRRLGVAFAVTEKLFAEDAEIIALALTYDFSSYGSIGVGGNFAGGERHGYSSLGINKKAFETVLKGLSGLFD